MWRLAWPQQEVLTKREKTYIPVPALWFGAVPTRPQVVEAYLLVIAHYFHVRWRSWCGRIPDTWSMAETYSDVYVLCLLFHDCVLFVFIIYNWYLFVQNQSMEIVYLSIINCKRKWYWRVFQLNNSSNERLCRYLFREHWTNMLDKNIVNMK